MPDSDDDNEDDLNAPFNPLEALKASRTEGFVSAKVGKFHTAGSVIADNTPPPEDGREQLMQPKKQKKEKKEKKLTVMQQEFHDYKIEQKRLRKIEMKRKQDEDMRIERAIAEAERKLAEKLAAEAEAERLRILEESKIRLKHIAHNPKEKPGHIVLDNSEKILKEQEEEEEDWMLDIIVLTITWVSAVIGACFICYAMGLTVLFKDQPFRPTFFWAGVALCSLLCPWSVFKFCPGCCIFAGETLRRKAITIRRKLRVKAKQTNHVRADEFDAEKEFDQQAEYKKQLEEFSVYKSLMNLFSKEERDKARQAKKDAEKKDSQRKDSQGGDIEAGRKSMHKSSINYDDTMGGGNKVSFAAPPLQKN